MAGLSVLSLRIVHFSVVQRRLAVARQRIAHYEQLARAVESELTPQVGAEDQSEAS